MVRTETIIAVKNVSASSAFYQKLLECSSAHGGETFEILKDDNTVILCLHKWGEHEHSTMIDAEKENAKNMHTSIEKEIHYNENSLKNQFILRDPDNYYLIISE
ncbi:VOC family protein [Elizabethkingia miricola]|uniref:VOC family protein n=1 Tax=Elizabethkingia miricola TaxID=172045 RepID=UPI000B363C86|nr:VOC family protein [Elizabethkingia miricola]NHQ65148.1 VOC family protein [Elizabethkingia miricola]NHQ69678.1 VOC family protein [Elizabethkingia miricola]NHQ77955.1 VOC family protein [Elizabethkingia miricola]PSL87144.1 VOC family protein [Elizabethkingia miricola]QHQ87850.1 VOC family protein [Elizabethkingia miricola]